MAPNETETYWDAKARANAHDPLGAVAHGDPLRDGCIDAVQRRLMRLALAEIRRRDRALHGAALDLGCGTGRWATALSDLGFAYHGIDISGAMIEIARREHPGAAFDKFDGQAIPFPDASMTLAMSLAVIHHNDYQHQEPLLDELVRVLEPGGWLIAFEGIGPRTSGKDGVFHYRPVADWRAAFEARGLVLQWQRGARYFALEHIGTSIAARLRLPGKPLSRPLLGIGRLVDPYLIAARPNRLHDRWMAVWRKSAQQDL